MIDRFAHAVARHGAVVLLLATAVACGFIAGRGDAAVPRGCDAALVAQAGSR